MNRTTLLFLLLGQLPAVADEIVLEPDRDNTLYEHAAGALSNGQGAYLFLGINGNDEIRRTALRFDVAGEVPAGSTITSVALTMNMSKTQITLPKNAALHRALASWGEGGSDAEGEEGAGALAQPTDATWLHRFFPDVFWSTAGGDFALTASAAVPITIPGPYLWTTTPQLVADVQSWLDQPAGNHGWILVGDESGAQSAKRFDSSQNGLSTVRPKLTVSFDPPSVLVYCTPKTSSAGCLAQVSTTDRLQGPVSGGADYSVLAAGVHELKTGLLFASLGGAANLPFNGGVLCMNPPLERGPIVTSGGSDPDGCVGTFATRVNDGPVIPNGLDAGPGATGWYQYWYRDPGNGPGTAGTALSDAVQLTFQ